MARTKAEKTPSEGPDRSGLQELYSAKLTAELAAADRLAPEAASVPVTGNPQSRVMAVKGIAGKSESAGGGLLAGPDGDALSKALGALDLGETWFATFSRAPGGGRTPGALERLTAQIEAMEPALIIALDSAAAEDVAGVSGLAGLPFGKPQTVKGRTVIALEGLEASLGDEKAKARVWRQLRTLKP